MKKRFNLILFILLLSGLDAIAVEENTLGSAYQNRILRYVPAPGQFIDEKLFSELSDTAILNEENICRFLTRKMKNQVGNYTLSLGAFGGYIVVGFDHSIKNEDGPDFRIFGNAFYGIGKSEGRNSTDLKKGTAEPGIIYVSKDVNKDGLPNDKWYEISGSQTYNEYTIEDYQITYYRPYPLNTNVLWRDNQGDSGYVFRNAYHLQDSYYPSWIEEDSLSFQGRRLADNTHNVSTEEGIEKWESFVYEYGYADNHPNNTEGALIDIEWAIDETGQKINIDSIDFVKVYTAVRQNAGWTGEISTEFGGVMDIRFTTNENDEYRAEKLYCNIYPNPCGDKVYVELNGIKDYNIVDHKFVIKLYNSNGFCVIMNEYKGQKAELLLQGLSKGLYIVEIIPKNTELAKKYVNIYYKIIKK